MLLYNKKYNYIHKILAINSEASNKVIVFNSSTILSIFDDIFQISYFNNKNRSKFDSSIKFQNAILS